MKIKILMTILMGMVWLVDPCPCFSQQMCPLDTMKPKKVKSLETLKRIPILNQGRIKPFETFARNFLLQTSGRQRYGKESATEWMARYLFAPRTTFDDKVFLINDPEIAEALGIKPEKHRRYTFNELNKGYEKLQELAEEIKQIDEKSQSVVDKEILRVYSNLHLFIRLSGAFSFALPHPDFKFSSSKNLRLLELPETGVEYFSFYEILDKSQNLSVKAQELEKKSHQLWNEDEREIARILNALSFWTDHYAECPLGLIPTRDPQHEEWRSPMDTIIGRFFDQDHHGLIKSLRDAAMFYWRGSQLEFDLALRNFMDAETKLLSPKEKEKMKKIPPELLYNKLNLFLWAKLFYGLGFILFLCSLLSERLWMRKAALIMTLLGFIPHVYALVLRVLIMSRPPVSNLFETFIFVGAISVGLGLILEKVNKNWLGLVVADTCGLILLLIAGKFSAEGDTMQMLVAVLNSNFWLSTHVLAITTGYAGCCVAGIMGHIYILQAITQPQNKKRLEITLKNMLGILGFGLTMSFLGTALGGIWADQSWGRFWGWDPKENGALMIVLWSAIVFHARIAKIINPLGVAVGCIFALINVVWAWFGVNLLSVGLHSYGFTSGIANSLMIFVLAEVAFISISVILLGKKGFKF